MSFFVTSIVNDVGAITPHDTTVNVPLQARGLHNSSATAGTVAIIMRDTTEKSIYMNAGDWIEIKVVRVKSTGTTVGSIAWFT